MKAIMMLMVVWMSNRAYAQKISAEAVPKPVQTVFIRDFPGVMPTWELSNGRYTANFEQHKYNMVTVYDGTGHRLETRVGIAEKELPESVREYIKAHNPANVSEAHKIITAGDKVSFKVLAGAQYLEFDGSGNYLRSVNK